MSDHTHEWVFARKGAMSTPTCAFTCNVSGCGAETDAVPAARYAKYDPPGRYGIIVIDPESPTSDVWAEPFDSEDSTPDPDEPEMRAALFATRAEAEAGLARRIRCEVRSLPPKVSS